MTRSRPAIVALILASFSALTSAMAYEAETHRAMSAAAFTEAKLSAALARLGLGPNDTFKAKAFSVTTGPFTAAEWIRTGGMHEDAPPWRVLNHFYDPINQTGMVFGVPSPEWAFESNGDEPSQGHSYPDARRALYRGLTAADPNERSRELGHAFYALGHVIHLVQDLAQAQHTRNDAHLPFGWDESLHEKYVERIIRTIALDGASLPQFPSSQVPAAIGLWTGPLGFAEFSNSNFVSEDTNFTDLAQGATGGTYPKPILDLAFTSSLPPGVSCRNGVGVPTPMTFHGNRFIDPVTNSIVENPRMTTYSIFDQHLVKQGSQPLFALNCLNIEAAADILLPRAVAYSAALLKYFFRGQLEARVELDHSTTPPASRLLVTNRTSGEAMTGDFTLHYDAADGTRKVLQQWGPLTLAPDQTSDPLPLPTPADQADPGRYLVVFRGQLGTEPDAVVGHWLGAGVYLVDLWYDTYYPTEGGALDFVPAPLPPWWDHTLYVSAYASETRWAFYEGASGESRAETVHYVYRPPEALPGNAATLRFRGHCYWTEPVTAELVELEPPPDLGALQAYTWSTRPAVQRVLHPFTVLAGTWADAATATVDLAGARFLGLRLLGAPVAPPPAPPVPFPPLSTSYAECVAEMQMRISPPEP
jgi:hypothetical protein